MVKGLGAGLVSGGFVGAVVLSMLSLYAPLPQDRIDAAPVLETQPTPSETVPASEDSSAVTPEAPAAIQTAQAESAAATEVADTDTTIAPQTEIAQAPIVAPATTQTTNASAAEVAQSADNAPKAEQVTSTPAASQGSESLAATSGADTLAANAPAEPARQVAAEIQAPTESTSSLQTTLEAAAVQPAAGPTETVVGKEQTAQLTPAPDTPPKPKLPTIGVETVSADTPITAPVPEITDPVAGVVTNRLPSLTTAAPAPESVTDVVPEEVAPVEENALRQFATQVEGIDGKSLFSVLLIDTGEDGLARDDLMKLAIPVTIAIDPTAPNATQIMAAYRTAGIEVVAIANDLPTASEPSDVAVAVSAYFDVLNEAVGIMDPLDGRIQSNRSLLQPVLGAIRDSGHGLITYDRGLNTAQQAARREDIPAATVFRVLDAELEEAPKIKRYLDRAAFTSGQDGTVVVVGRSYAETVKAVVEWALEKKDASIAMVPVSAVMLATQDN